MNSMPNACQLQLAQHYFVDDLAGAKQTGARLNGILQKLAAGEKVSELSRKFLATTGLHALCTFSSDGVSPEEFRELATTERAARIAEAALKAEQEANEKEALAAANDAEMKAIFAARANGPALKARQLKQRFGLGFVEREHYRRVMRLLTAVDMGQRLGSADVAWLQTEAEDCWTDQLQKAYHRLEAEAFDKEWHGSGDARKAVQASKHWRKADDAGAALRATEQAIALDGLSPKLKSALATTRGGAMRDCARFGEAEALGFEAHHLKPDDYRPCTLLGAICIQQGNLAEGLEWYAKAEQRGANRKGVDQELKSLVAQAAGEDREKICAFLLQHNPERFGWVRSR